MSVPPFAVPGVPLLEGDPFSIGADDRIAYGSRRIFLRPLDELGDRAVRTQFEPADVDQGAGIRTLAPFAAFDRSPRPVGSDPLDLPPNVLVTPPGPIGMNSPFFRSRQ